MRSAAECYREIDIDKAIETYRMSIAVDVANSSHLQAARTCEDIAEILIQEGKEEQAIECWKEASDYYDSASQPAKATQVYLKLADKVRDRGDYSEAAELYEKAAKTSVSEKINKGSIQEYYFYALLCYFVESAIKRYDTEFPRSKMADYVNEDRRYSSTREFKLLAQLFEMFDAEEIKEYTKALAQYNQQKEMDEGTIQCFLKIKQILKSGPPDQIGAPADAGDGDSDYT